MSNVNEEKITKDKMPRIKAVFNRDYGGFGLSEDGKQRMVELGYQRKGDDPPDIDYRVSRHDPYLVQAVEELGDKANGSHAKLSITTIPEVFQNYYLVRDYDGEEWLEIDYTGWVKDQLPHLTAENAETWRNHVKEMLSLK